MSKANPHLHDPHRIEHVFNSANILRIACLDPQGNPYLIPVNFGTLDGKLYFHSSKTGKKMECLRRNAQIAFQCDCHNEVVFNENPCKMNMHYHSVTGSGMVSFMSTLEEKRQGLACILKQFGVSAQHMSEGTLERTEVLRIDILECSYKQSPV